MSELAAKCREFIVRQSCGEWTDQQIDGDTHDLVEFITGLDGATRATRTLRDEFAMAALTGIMSNSSSPPMGDDYPENNTGAARVAYLLADAMLAARGGA